MRGRYKMIESYWVTAEREGRGRLLYRYAPGDGAVRWVCRLNTYDLGWVDRTLPTIGAQLIGAQLAHNVPVNTAMCRVYRWR